MDKEGYHGYCTHQWHDITTSAGPEWVCVKCRVNCKIEKTLLAPQRPWVGLTDEQRTEIRREHYGRTLPLMDAVEAKLKELNA